MESCSKILLNKILQFTEINMICSLKTKATDNNCIAGSVIREIVK